MFHLSFSMAANATITYLELTGHCKCAKSGLWGSLIADLLF
jgi:hypothetical protein